MQTVSVSLPTPAVVQAFVEQLATLCGQFDLLSDGYILDARSLMGIFGLDLTKPIQLRIEKSTKENIEGISRFIAETQEQTTAETTTAEPNCVLPQPKTAPAKSQQQP